MESKDSEEVGSSSPRPSSFDRFLGQRLSAAASVVGRTTLKLTEVIGRTAQSARDVIVDKDLRSQVVKKASEEAGRHIKGLQQGVQNRAAHLQHGIVSGPRHIQTVLQALQQRIEEQRLHALLQAERDAPVDVQVGPLLYENAPQELRSRLWAALLADTALKGQLHGCKVHPPKHGGVGISEPDSNLSTPATSPTAGSPKRDTLAHEPAPQPSNSDAAPGSTTPEAPSSSLDPNSSSPSAMPGAKSSSTFSGTVYESALEGSLPAASMASSRGPLASTSRPSPLQTPAEPFFSLSEAPVEPESVVIEEAGRTSSWGGRVYQSRLEATIDPVAVARAASLGPTEASGSVQLSTVVEIPASASGGAGPSLRVDAGGAAGGEQTGAPQASGARACTTEDSEAGSLHMGPWVAASPRRRSSSDAFESADPPHASTTEQSELSSAPGGGFAWHESDAPPLGAHPASTDQSEWDADGGLDAWEMVQGSSKLYDFSSSSASMLEARLAAGMPCAGAALLRPEAAAWHKRVLAASLAVRWPISTEYPEGCRYSTLMQISIGQEDVDEVITRDIHRTFPEHPQFSNDQGQQALFRVLKAMSLHDLQVGYCQGMAFVAGVVLMYLPEEPAFQVLVRLMEARGAHLRRLYLPGLEGLKQFLRMFEWLLAHMLPDLKLHLEAYGVVPVLYASQWFLTAFSCPFPAPFAARVLDCMLTEGSSEVMLRAGLAIMAECQLDLLGLADFEDLITFLKVEPVKWARHRSRRVLNSAIESLLDPDILRAAQHAVEVGYEGSLSRRGSAVNEAPTAVAVVEATSPKHARLASLPEELDFPHSPDQPQAAPAPQAEEGAGAVGGVLAAQQAEMEEDYLAFVLALDSLWSGNGQEGGQGADPGHLTVASPRATSDSIGAAL